MKLFLAFSLFLFGQGLGFSTRWENPEPGDMLLPDFQTFDYEWKEYSLEDVKDFSVIFLFHPLDNTAAKTRERNLGELSILNDFISVFAITHEGNWGSNRELGKRVEPEYPILFSQPDTNLESWVRSWKKSLPSALLVKGGEVLAHGEPLAILSVVLDIEEGFEIPPVANSGGLGFWSDIENLEDDPKSNLKKWLNWKHMNSQPTSSRVVLEEGLLMLGWSEKMGKKIKRNLAWGWLSRVIEAGPPEGQSPDTWLEGVLPEISSWEGLEPDSRAWVYFLAQDFENASIKFDESAIEGEGFMASISEINSLVSKSLYENLEAPQAVLPALFEKIFTTSRESTRGPLMEYFLSMVEKQEAWWPRLKKPDHFYFVQGIARYYSKDRESSFQYFEKLKNDPDWLSVLHSWEIY